MNGFRHERLWLGRALVFTLVLLSTGVASFAFADQKKILVLGDSLSAAYRIPLEDGWVNLLQERLEQTAGEDNDFSHFKVINASISGATTAAGLQRLDGLLTSHLPSIVLLELGANDGLQGKPLRYIRSNLNTLIQGAKSSGAEVVVFGIRLPPNYGSAYTEPFFEQFFELAEKHDASYLPFLLEGVAGHDELMQADGLHPKAEAQPRILNNVWPVLSSVLSRVSN